MFQRSKIVPHRATDHGQLKFVARPHSRHHRVLLPLCTIVFHMASTSLPLSDQDQPQWPVHVFRKTSTGWERLRPYNAQGQLVLTHVTPREGCVIFPRLRLRVSLKSNDSHQYRSTVVRRRNSILLSSSQGVKAMILRFQSLQECLDFSDRFVALNPLSVATDATKEQRDGTTEDDAAAAEQNQQVFFYMARLLHDQDFIDYVDNLEACLSSSEDGMKMLEALTKSATSNNEGTASEDEG